LGNYNDKQVNYAEGILIGYRWFDAKGIAPLFPFGYGLSYTTFAYEALTLSRKDLGAGDRLTVRATVRNTGDCAGDEVVQLYIEPLAPSVPAPKLHLEGVRRIHLASGGQTEVVFEVHADQFRHYRDDGVPFLDPGAYRIHVGGGQPGYAKALRTDTVEVRNE